MLDTKGSKTHTECVIFIAFPQQQSLLESASILRYIYISCIFCLVVYYRSACSKLCTLKPIIMLLNLRNCGSDKKKGIILKSFCDCNCSSHNIIKSQSYLLVKKHFLKKKYPTVQYGEHTHTYRLLQLLCNYASL